MICACHFWMASVPKEAAKILHLLTSYVVQYAFLQNWVTKLTFRMTLLTLSRVSQSSPIKKKQKKTEENSSFRAPEFKHRCSSTTNITAAIVSAMQTFLTTCNILWDKKYCLQVQHMFRKSPASHFTCPIGFRK